MEKIFETQKVFENLLNKICADGYGFNNTLIFLTDYLTEDYQELLKKQDKKFTKKEIEDIFWYSLFVFDLDNEGMTKTNKIILDSYLNSENLFIKERCRNFINMRNNL